MEQNIEVYAETREASAERVRRFLMDFLPGKDLVVNVKKKTKERSDPQNKALWGCAYDYLRKATGNDKEDLHDYFCGEFFGWKEYEVMGKRKLKPVRTTTTNEAGKRDVISTEELSEFYAFIQQHAAQGGHYVPDPDPNWFHEEKRKAA